jgi:subtilisin family serine protease
VDSLGLAIALGSVEQLDGLPIFRLSIAKGLNVEAVVALLESNPLVVFAEANYLGEVPEGVQQSAWVKGQDEGDYMQQWAPKRLRLAEAHSVTRGAGVTVAILDTGVDPEHPALKARLVAGFDFVGLDADPSEEGVYGKDVGYGHGTHVAGLVALAAPEARIMPLRVLRPDGTGDSWLLAQGLRYLATHRVDVINISYAVSQRSLLVEELLGALVSGTARAVVVAAAGNSGGSNPEYPAAEGAPGLLAVAASTKGDRLAAFSSYGQWVDVAAPGERIVSAVPLASGSAYGAWSGTSMAAPLAAGTAALLRAVAPQLGPGEVAERLVAAGAPMRGPVGRRLDAAAAVGAAPTN